MKNIAMQQFKQGIQLSNLSGADNGVRVGLLSIFNDNSAEAKLLASEKCIEEMRDEAYFDVYYECKFPGEDSMDENSYRTLITNEEITQALVERMKKLLKREIQRTST